MYDVGIHLSIIAQYPSYGWTKKARDTCWICVAVVVHYRCVDRDTIYRWIDSKGLPAHRVDRFWESQLSEVDARIKSGETDVSIGAGTKGPFSDSTKQGR